MSVWNRTCERHRSRHETLAVSAQRMRPLERIALICELALSRDPGARRVARALLRQFPDLPGGDWIAEHLDRLDARSSPRPAHSEL